MHYIKPSLNTFQRQSPKLNDTCLGSHGKSSVKFGRKTGSIAKQESQKKHEDWSAYPIKRQQLQKLLTSAHDDYIRNVIGASLLDRGNQKKCWSFVKFNRTENLGIPILSDTNGLHITNQAKAEALDTDFVSVFTSDHGKHLPDKGLSPYHDMGIIQFTTTRNLNFTKEH